jgi:hypothetical protein
MNGHRNLLSRKVTTAIEYRNIYDKSARVLTAYETRDLWNTCFTCLYSFRSKHLSFWRAAFEMRADQSIGFSTSCSSQLSEVNRKRILQILWKDCTLAVRFSDVAKLTTLTPLKINKINSVASVRKRTIPTERPPLVSEVSASFFADRGCQEVSVTNPYGSILGFLDGSRYYFFQVAPQLYSRGWVDPVPELLFFSCSARESNPRPQDL